MVAALLVGFAFGFVGSMPVAGPISALVVKRGIDGHYRDGLLVAAGSVLAEVVYAFLAFWGFSTLLAEYDWVKPASFGIAALILVVLGVVFLRRDPDDDPDGGDSEQDERSGAKAFATGLGITGLNPTLIATWSGAATTLFSTGWVEFDQTLAWPFALGAGLGITGWYGLLLWLIRRYKDNFHPTILNRVIQGFGLVLIGVGGWFGWKLIDWLMHDA